MVACSFIHVNSNRSIAEMSDSPVMHLRVGHKIRFGQNAYVIDSIEWYYPSAGLIQDLTVRVYLKSEV